MGSKKSGILEKVKEGKETGSKAIEKGTSLENSGQEIKAILDGIDTSIDEEDLSAVEMAESNYEQSFDSEFKETVDTTETQMESIEKGAISEGTNEKAKVDDASQSFEQMLGVSDVGRGSADSAKGSMDRSSSEYSEYIENANEVIDETSEDVENLRNALGEIFG